MKQIIDETIEFLNFMSEEDYADAVEALRKQTTLCSELAKVLQDWETKNVNDGWAYKRRDVLDKYEELNERARTT